MSQHPTSDIRWRTLVPISTIAANVLSYVLFLVAARLLDRATYGETLALLNLVVIATIPSFAIQTVVARRTATNSVGPRTLRVAAAIGLIGAALITISSGLLVNFLYLPSSWGVLGGAACVPSLVLLGVAQGVAQGSRRWRLLCLAVVLMGVGRVAGGVIGLLVAPSSAGALLGSAIGLAAAALILVRPTMRILQDSPVDRSQTVRGLLAETAHAAHAHGIFLLLSSLDLTIARNVLSAEDAGWYAAGNVVFRAALWLPQPVTTLLFASLSDWARQRRATRDGLAIIGGLGLATIAGCAALGTLVAAIVGGKNFSDLGDDVWVFAVAGSGLALTQFCIYAGLAVLRRGRLALVWGCVAAEIVAAYGLGLTTTPLRLIATVAIIVATAALVGVIVALLTKPSAAELLDPRPQPQMAPNTIEPL